MHAWVMVSNYRDNAKYANWLKSHESCTGVDRWDRPLPKYKMSLKHANNTMRQGDFRVNRAQFVIVKLRERMMCKFLFFFKFMNAWNKGLKNDSCLSVCGLTDTDKMSSRDDVLCK